ncbi:MAG TPA: flagellar hook protein FlgE [Rhizomicrobium sp.]|jgi:flagellar hook protein FlgE|nr:flagellar hook protein FlgE [Rhizomicrobium sp.]
MSLYDAMIIGVAGLDANSRALSIASSNIANVNTVGYKSSQSAFSTMLAASGTGDAASAAGVMANAQQNIVQQGLIFSTSSPTDLAISGQGFFVVNTQSDGSGQQLYTRAGSFTPDADGNMRNTAGLYVMGWPVNPDGTVSADPGNLQAINLTTLEGKGVATTKMSLQQNLQASDAEDASYVAGDMYAGNATPEFQRTTNFFDSQGGTNPLQISYIKTGPDQWAYEVVYAGDEAKVDQGGDPNPIATGTLTFDANGNLAQVNGSASSGSVDVTVPFNSSSGLNPQTISLDFGTIGTSSGTSQFDSDSVLTAANVDGAVYGSVTGVTVKPDGMVYANYSNGLSAAAFELPLADFPNADGLAQVSGNAFAQTADSGDAVINQAGTAGLGTLSANSLEGSTVDLATEFTNMITTQRAYSASARVVTTASQMLDDLIQISR